MRPSEKKSFPQKVMKNVLESMMKVKIDGIKRVMGVLNDGLKSYMEAIMNLKI